MQKRNKRTLHHLISILLLIALLITLILQMTLYTSGNERYFSGDAEAYYQELLQAGFPEDYAVSLTELHLLHPNWNFVPLKVTELNASYTWNYVISQETEDEATNLISKSSTYSAYWHETNRNEPETGYYQASRATVEYFMDPRNFLNETDIFQFYDLSESTTASLEAVEAVLANTFMENTTLENGKTYAQYFCEIGEEIGMNPVYLAVKVRQEQGVAGTSPIISGACGTLLNSYYQNQTQQTESGREIKPPQIGKHTEEELLALNGYYNYNNIKASGEGIFEIYYKAMLGAQQGTPSMADKWGGSPSWNTRWKSLYGGAYFLKDGYISNSQVSIYLQKFNVDPRSERNFEKQYMQSVQGAMNEGRSLYQSFASIGMLDSVCTFLIPVYGGMYDTVSADPANGACARLAVATAQYDYQNKLTSPLRQSADNATLYLNYDALPFSTLQFSGSFTHSYGVEGLEYRWDDDDWRPLSDGKSADISIAANFSENTSHILVVRGKAAYDHDDSTRKQNAYFLCAVIYVEVIPPPNVTLSYQIANTVTDRTVRAGTELTLPVCESPDFAGWLGSDGSFLPSGASFVIQTDLTYSAIFLDFQKLDGAALSLDQNDLHLRFFVVLRNDSFEKLTAHSDETIQMSAVLTANGTQSEPIALRQKNNAVDHLLCFSVDTPSLLTAEYTTAHSAEFYAELHYTNGESTTLTAVGDSFSRSAIQVASSALADTAVQYSDTEIKLLENVVGKS